MSRKLVLQIANSQLAEAKETLNEELATVIAAKLHEKKKMIAAGAINESESTTVRSGFLTVRHKKDAVHIEFGGNMGQNEGDVEKAFDRLHGPGTFAKVRPYGEFHKDNAGNVHKHADYSYVLKVPKKNFNSELGIKDVAAHYASMNAKSDNIMKDAIKGAADNQRAYEKKQGKVDEGLFVGNQKRAYKDVSRMDALKASYRHHIGSDKKGAAGTLAAGAAVGAGVFGAYGLSPSAGAALGTGAMAAMHAHQVVKTAAGMRGTHRNTNFDPSFAKEINKDHEEDNKWKKYDRDITKKAMKITAKRILKKSKKWIMGVKEETEVSEGILNKVKKAVNKIGQAKRLGAKIDYQMAANDKTQSDAGRDYKEARKKLDASDPGSARQMFNWDKVISASKKEAAAAARASSLIRRSGRVAGFKSFKRKNPKGLAEGNNPDAKLTMQGKRDRIQNMHNDLHRGHPDVTPADEASVQRMIKNRIKSLKEAMSAKEAAAKAEKLVSSRTKENEKTRRDRNNKNRDSDTMNIHDKSGESFGDWKKRKGKE